MCTLFMDEELGLGIMSVEKELHKGDGIWPYVPQNEYLLWMSSYNLPKLVEPYFRHSFVMYGLTDGKVSN